MSLLGSARSRTGFPSNRHTFSPRYPTAAASISELSIFPLSDFKRLLKLAVDVGHTNFHIPRQRQNTDINSFQPCSSGNPDIEIVAVSGCCLFSPSQVIYPLQLHHLQAGLLTCLCLPTIITILAALSIHSFSLRLLSAHYPHAGIPGSNPCQPCGIQRGGCVVS